MKSRFFRDRNLRLLYKKNEIKFRILRTIFNQSQISFGLRHKIFLLLTIRKSWTFNNKIKNRCLLTVRNRGNNKLTKMSRFMIRKYISQGLLPGFILTKW